MAGGDPSGESVTVSPLQAEILEVIAGPDDRSQSVVSVLHDLEDAGVDTNVDDVRSALRGLVDRGVLERIQRSVPTFRLTVGAENLDVQVLSDEDESEGEGEDGDSGESEESDEQPTAAEA